MDDDILSNSLLILSYLFLYVSFFIQSLFDLIISYSFLFVPFTILFGCGVIIFVYKLLKR